MNEVVKDVVHYGEIVVQTLKRAANTHVNQRQTKAELDKIVIDASRAINQVVDALLKIEYKAESEIRKQKARPKRENTSRGLLVQLAKHIRESAEEIIDSGLTRKEVSLSKGGYPQAVSELVTTINASSKYARTTQLFSAARFFGWQIFLMDSHNRIIFDSAEYQCEEFHNEFEQYLRLAMCNWIKTQKTIGGAARLLNVGDKTLGLYAQENGNPAMPGLHWDTTIKFIKEKRWVLRVYSKKGTLLLTTEAEDEDEDEDED